MGEKEKLVVLNPERICFNCIHHTLCIFRRKVAEAIAVAPFGAFMNDAPGNEADIYMAMAGACYYFKKETYGDDEPV